MVDNKKKKGLGRGLSALLDQGPSLKADAKSQTQSAPIDLIAPNPDQPRRRFPPSELAELEASIREKGVLQPLLVRRDPSKSDGYQIVAGERRWRAAQAAGLHELPIIQLDLDDLEVLEIAIIENVQRADLDPIEEAAGYAQLIEKFGHTQSRLAEVVGKSRPHVANALRLLTLPEVVREHIAQGRLTAGHARALVTASDPAALAAKVIAEGLSVRQTEALAKSVTGKPAPRPKTPTKDADTRVLESDLSAAIGLKVSIDHTASGSGQLRVSYKTLDELGGLCQLLNR